MKRSFLLSLTLFATFTSALKAELSDHTYYPTDLYLKVENNEIQDEALKDHLFKVLDMAHLKSEGDHDKLIESCNKNKGCYSQLRNISYKQARKYLFGQLHLERRNNKYIVKDLYCNISFGESVGVGKNKIPNPQQINCEHTWPQSRFNPRMSKGLQKTDLHHLYPVNSKANSSRGNHIFAEVNGREINGNCKSSSRGMALGSSITAFQPPKRHRGNVARALFYFSVRYKMPIDPLEESFLRVWHEEDPVDEVEIERNNKIFDIQGNRNPFIDEPDLVFKISDF